MRKLTSVVVFSLVLITAASTAALPQDSDPPDFCLHEDFLADLADNNSILFEFADLPTASQKSVVGTRPSPE